MYFLSQGQYSLKQYIPGFVAVKKRIIQALVSAVL